MTGRLSADHPLAALYAGIDRYYTHKVNVHGATPLGVDWPSHSTQELRFEQLLRVCDMAAPFSLNDIGCGYGALLAFLARQKKRTRIDYLGVDLSASMVAHARRLWHEHPETEFVAAKASPRVADYSVASGIFNVKLSQPLALWETFVEETLADMHKSSRKGFAVNFLAPPAGDNKSPPELYRTAPERWQRHCEQSFGARVEVLHAGGLQDEYTLLVRTPGGAG
ncbi:Methyltransferase domain-containing protein [Polaromonas sp. YR568]|uniref:class I SAM-dependent methyltransferase n=1 Tax=Polaromonas sp. YR568 TaxID=1855301 RepID=UPI0008E037FF|nr:class I SAM-dependent methyltransferase [Polaromonas sp. YR568]SFU99860.1 Methyltransferase domain-containing protein [Polaromonas sp. YR568]